MSLPVQLIDPRRGFSARVTDAGELVTTQSSGTPQLEISAGNQPGYEIVHKFGRNPDIDTTTDPEDVWATGGTMGWPSTAVALTVSSTSANDDGTPPSNSGAHTLRVIGLGSGFVEIEETVTLAGTTPVVTEALFLRVNRAYVETTGTYHGTNEGTITASIGASPVLTIVAGAGQTDLARFSVPTGKHAYMQSLTVGVDSTKTASVSLYQCPNADDATQPYLGAKRLALRFDGVSGVTHMTLAYPIRFVPKTDLWFTVEEVAANNTSVSVDFELVLIED